MDIPWVVIEFLLKGWICLSSYTSLLTKYMVVAWLSEDQDWLAIIYVVNPYRWVQSHSTFAAFNERFNTLREDNCHRFVTELASWSLFKTNHPY